MSDPMKTCSIHGTPLNGNGECLPCTHPEVMTPREILKETVDRRVTDRDAAIRDRALEEAALISDKHWPESGHVPCQGAVSCAMSTSIEIRRLKTDARLAADAPKEGK